MVNLEMSNQPELVYADMKKQFPASELKTFARLSELLANDDYNLYLANDLKMIGYVLIATSDESIWLDYLAILEQFHSKGYGRLIVKSFEQHFKGLRGCFLEVEQIDETKPNTTRRVKFYEELGAIKINRRYFYPHKNGELKMDLYFIPFESGFIPDDAFINRAISNIFKLLHSELPHASVTLAKNLA